MKVHNDCSSDKVSAAAKAPPSQKSRCTSTTISARLILFSRTDSSADHTKTPPLPRGQAEGGRTNDLLRCGRGRQRLHRCFLRQQRVVGEMSVKLFSHRTL